MSGLCYVRLLIYIYIYSIAVCERDDASRSYTSV